MRELNLTEIEAINGGLDYTYTKAVPYHNSSDYQDFDAGFARAGYPTVS